MSSDHHHLVCRLVVTAAGFDGRLIHAAQTLVHLHESYVADEQLQFLVPSLGKITDQSEPMPSLVHCLVLVFHALLAQSTHTCKSLTCPTFNNHVDAWPCTLRGQITQHVALDTMPVLSNPTGWSDWRGMSKAKMQYCTVYFVHGADCYRQKPTSCITCLPAL